MSGRLKEKNEEGQQKADEDKGDDDDGERKVKTERREYRKQRLYEQKVTDVDRDKEDDEKIKQKKR